MSNLRRTFPARIYLLLTALLLAAAPPVSYAANPRNQVDFYVETYGRVAPEDNVQAALAHRIFHRLKGVAGSNTRSQPRLAVVDSPGDPWAISLPDGHIVLSQGAIGLCHELRNITEACLAFILGHELAHIANNDYWHHEVSRFLATSGNASALVDSLDKNADMELKADDDGFIYAAMAGFSVDKLLRIGTRGEDFFHYWSQQTSTRILAKDPALGIRADLLRKRLMQIQEKLIYFEFGVRLAHFDYCDDAVQFFASFQQTFPGREVLNNLGFCYLQIARQQMSPARAYFYWMPLQLDGETRATSLSQRGGKTATRLRDMEPGPEQDALARAVDYLQNAIANDPYYLPARINLAVAYLYSNQPHQARAVLDEARALAPDNYDVQALEALSIYEQSDSQINLLPNALARLQNLAKNPDASPAILFNLIQLSKLAGSDEELDKELDRYTRRLLSAGTRLPGPISSLLCNATATMLPACRQVHTGGRQPATLSRSWPLPSQGWQQLTPQLRQTLADWKRTPVDWDAQGAIYRQPDEQAAALIMDRFIQMQIVKNSDQVTFGQLKDYCAGDLRKRELPSGELWSCGNWAALTHNQTVSELWWVAR